MTWPLANHFFVRDKMKAAMKLIISPAKQMLIRDTLMKDCQKGKGQTKLERDEVDHEPCETNADQRTR